MSSSMFVKRPKRGENDDDLLGFQEEFLKQNGGKPAATVVRVQSNTPSTNAASSDHIDTDTPSVSTNNDVKPEDDLMDEDTGNVLTDVVTVLCGCLTLVCAVSDCGV